MILLGSILFQQALNKLTSVAGNIGVLVMLNGFGDCMSVIPITSFINQMMPFIETNSELLGQNSLMIQNLTNDNGLINLFQEIGCTNINTLPEIRPNISLNMMKIIEIANFEMTFYGLSSIEETSITHAFIKNINPNYTVPQTIGARSVCNDLKEDYQDALEDCTDDLDGNLGIAILWTGSSGPWAPLVGAGTLTYSLYTWNNCKGRALRAYRKNLKRAGCI